MSDTMVKAKIDDETNAYIERVRDSTDMNKTEATAYVLERATALDVTGVDDE